MDDCPACGHRAYVTFGPDIRGGGMLQRMWRAECAAPQLCAAPTFTRFTRESAEASWNAYVRRQKAEAVTQAENR